MPEFPDTCITECSILNMTTCSPQPRQKGIKSREFNFQFSERCWNVHEKMDKNYLYESRLKYLINIIMDK